MPFSLRCPHHDISFRMETFETNCTAPLLVTRSRYEENLIGGNANQTIVANMSSVQGSTERNNLGDMCAYRISKAALNMLAKCFTVEIGDRGVIVVNLHPGHVRSRVS